MIGSLFSVAQVMQASKVRTLPQTGSLLVLLQTCGGWSRNKTEKCRPGARIPLPTRMSPHLVLGRLELVAKNLNVNVMTKNLVVLLVETGIREVSVQGYYGSRFELNSYWGADHPSRE